ncbi:MAG: Na+/H+ antiporter NhaA [Terrisporobacter sp.]
MRYKLRNRGPEMEIVTSILLILATISALIICNTSLKSFYDEFFYNTYIISNFSVHNFVNDFLMSIFFLLAGLEIKEEMLYGSLSTLKKASFPVIASLGGVIVPAIIFYFYNVNTEYLIGLCIPISTDIAFAMGVYYLFSKYLGQGVKMFLLSLAVVDDLVSILLIGTVYSSHINFTYLFIGLIYLLLMIIGNKKFHIENLIYYLIGGLCLWYFIHLSGIHSTISGILLAIAIPSNTYKNSISTLHKLENYIRPINSLIIIPLFAFANTGLSLNHNLNLSNYPSLFFGIYFGLLIGKPLGIMLFTLLSHTLKLSTKPKGISWRCVFLVSLIASIGFTMSIFVSKVAFIGKDDLINASRIIILLSGVTSILISSLAIKTFKELHII